LELEHFTAVLPSSWHVVLTLFPVVENENDAFVVVVGSVGAPVIRIVGAPIVLGFVAALESDAVPVNASAVTTPSKAAYMRRRRERCSSPITRAGIGTPLGDC
jgi:hypothetical protein